MCHETQIVPYRYGYPEETKSVIESKSYSLLTLSGHPVKPSPELTVGTLKLEIRYKTVSGGK